MYSVQLVKAPVINTFRSDYFPRKIKYKKDAIKLASEVKKMGGEASVKAIK